MFDLFLNCQISGKANTIYTFHVLKPVLVWHFPVKNSEPPILKSFLSDYGVMGILCVCVCAYI